MAPFGYSFVRPTLDRFEVRLAGPLNEASMLQLETELGVRLAHAPAQQLQVMVDLRRVEDYSLQARDLFVRIQRFLASRARRTAYIADRPNLRALALWTVRMSEDPCAHVALDSADAERWLGEASPGGVPQDTLPSDRAAPSHAAVTPRIPGLPVGQATLAAVRADVLGEPK